MKELLQWARSSRVAGFLVLAASLSAAVSSRANIYATDIKLNGSTQLTSTAIGNPVPISYILNEPATAGVSINILSNGVSIRTITIPTNALATNGAGLSLGLNTVVWDGNDSTTNSAGVGAITVSVTASALGNASWTLITTNAISASVSNGGYYVFNPRGIAVNTDTNSFAYGRVYVANAQTGPNFATVAGDIDSILMFNADGSVSDAGESSKGGYPMHDANFSLPQKLRFGDDDRLYMNDLYNGQIVAFDDSVQGNEIVLDGGNYSGNPFINEIANGVGWFSFDVTSANTTNGLVWLGEYDNPGAGVWFWSLTNGIANPADSSGTNSVGAGFGSALSEDASGGLMVGTNFNVFVSQSVDDSGDTNFRSMMFANANAASVATNAAWAVGANDDTFRDIYDTTIDARQQPHYVACALSGPNSEGVRLLSATNGATLVANLDPTNTYFATAWDSVGNLYGASASLHAWRVWSPPGPGNTATTVGLVTVKTVDQLTILDISLAAGQVTLSFTASSTNALSNFSVLESPVVPGVFTPAVGYSVTNGVRPGLFTAFVPTNDATEFYIIKD